MNPGIAWMGIELRLRRKPKDVILIQIDRHNQYQRIITAYLLRQSRRSPVVRCSARGADFIEFTSR